MKKNSLKTLENIYSYNNYRKFLDDYFTFLNDENKRFSFRSFCKKFEIKSPNLIGLVIRGERNISTELAETICEALQLKLKKRRYFLSLIKYNQAKNSEDADKFFADIIKIKKSTGYYDLNEAQYEYYNKWYYHILKELVVWYPWNGDYSILAKAIKPSITPLETERGIKLLQKIGLIKLNDNGQFVHAENIISGESVPTHKKSILRETVMNLGIEATKKFTKKERYTSFHTITLSDDDYKKAIEVIKEAEDKLRELAENSIGEESKTLGKKVCEILFNIFPVSKAEKNEKMENKK